MLTGNQIKELENKIWNVKPEGCYLVLYKEDYSTLNWFEICRIIGNSVESESVTVLIFGYNEN